MAKKISSSQTLENRLRAYGAMSLACSALAVPQAAHAGQISWNAGITTTVALPSIYFDLATGSYGTSPDSGLFNLTTEVRGPLAKARLTPGTNLNLAFAVASFSSQPTPARWQRGDVVGPALQFARAFSTLGSNVTSAFGFWNDNAAAGDLGLSIAISGSTYYGWADITVDPVSYAITLNSFGRSDVADQVIVAGPSVAETPEPASILLLCLGASGIAAYRRKNQLD